MRSAIGSTLAFLVPLLSGCVPHMPIGGTLPPRPAIVLNSEEVKYYKIPLPRPWSAGGYRITMRTSLIPMPEDSAAFLEGVLDDPQSRDWEQKSTEILWPSQRIESLSTDFEFCTVLVRVINPKVRLKEAGYVRLYNEPVNVSISVKLTDRDASEVQAYTRLDTTFSLAGNAFFVFVLSDAPSDEKLADWAGNVLRLGVIYSLGEDTLYRQELLFEAAPPEEP